MNKLEIVKEKRSLIVLLIFLAAVFYCLMQSFFYPLILASIVVVLTFPLYRRLNHSFKEKPRLTAFMMTLVIFVTFILPTVLVGTIFVDQLYSLVNTIDLRETYANLFTTGFYSEYVAPLVTDFETRFKIEINVFDLLTQIGKRVASYIYNFSPAVLVGTAGFVFNFFIMIVSIFFLFIEGPALFRLLMDLSPMRAAHEQRLAKQFINTVQASIYGYLLTSLVQGLLAALAFAVTGLGASVVLGVLTFFMSMVPVIGAAGVWVPVTVWLFLQGETAWGIFNLVYGVLLISGIDNILKPLIIQGRTKIHPLLIFFSIFGGIKFFGPLGLLFGPVVTAMLIATIKIYRTEFQS